MSFTKVPDTPMEILLDHLQKAKAVATENARVPKDLSDHLQQALDIASGHDEYLQKMATPESEILAEIYRKTLVNDWDQVFEEGKTQFRLVKECISGHVEGQALKMLVHMCQAKRILEIGTFTGYSALAMAEALPPNGCLIACDLEPYVKEFTKPFFDKSPHGKKINVKIGPAIDSLKELAAAGEQFDMVYIDADKGNYINYYKFIVDNNMVKLSGIICVDNTLFKAAVYLKNSTDERGLALREFNDFVVKDPRVEQVMLPLRDGVTLIRRVSPK